MTDEPSIFGVENSATRNDKEETDAKAQAAENLVGLKGPAETVSERGYKWIKNLKKQTGKNIPELVATTQQTDPFFSGSKMDRRQAEWFAKMWKQHYEGQTGIHLRRIHYKLATLAFAKLNGKPYKLAKIDFDFLIEASRHARLLGLVPADAFDDHRNPDPYALNWHWAEAREPQAPAPYFGPELPALRLNPLSVDWTLDTPEVTGYDPDDYLDRRYLLELWIEKSTMDDILVPLCDELGVRLAPSV